MRTCSPGCPTNRICGSMINFTPAALTRSARAWNSGTVIASPKCGTGTGSPSVKHNAKLLRGYIPLHYVQCEQSDDQKGHYWKEQFWKNKITNGICTCGSIIVAYFMAHYLHFGYSIHSVTSWTLVPNWADRSSLQKTNCWNNTFGKPSQFLAKGHSYDKNLNALEIDKIWTRCGHLNEHHHDLQSS